jgi:hypothetical protein
VTGCPCHDPAVFGHIQRTCPVTSLSRHQLEGGSGQLVAFTRPLTLEPVSEAAPPAAAAAVAPEPFISAVITQRRRVLVRLFTS